ncbi:uncharacterized protein LOC118494182 [Sander lucioperca]|uniref:uncharacterized protein LOC118494182 n=1 Tax=Sander lucioperca TaxID=283035 RepID=UPI00165351F0|nr:uncharacterized protein LOC118494182 [Sander lucioperca]
MSILVSSTLKYVSLCVPLSVNISLGRVEAGVLAVDGSTLIITFTEREANVRSIQEKVKADLRIPENIILCDAQGNRLLEGSGTAGLDFWLQNARRIVALQEDAFEELQRRKRRRSSRVQDDTEVLHRVEELVLTAQDLPNIAQMMREMAGLAELGQRLTGTLTEAQATSVKDTFRCLICRGPMTGLVIAPCCRSLVGCNGCVRGWVLNSANCPKCRDERFGEDYFLLSGMDDVMDALRNVVSP